MSKEITRLTATKMGEELNILPKRGAGASINKALIAAGYMSSDDTGYHLTEKASYEKDGVVIPFGIEKTRGGKSYILWNEATLKNKLFLKKLEEITSSKDDSPKKETSSKKKSLEDFKKSDAYQPSRDGAFQSTQDKIAVAKYLKDWDLVKKLEATVIPMVRTIQGFEVRSQGECRVIDMLTEHYGVKIYSDKQFLSKEVLFCDFVMRFMTPDGLIEIWIELWGRKDKPYLDRKKIKKDIYEKEGVILVNLEYDKIMYDLDGLLLREFDEHPALQDMDITLLELRDIDFEQTSKYKPSIKRRRNRFKKLDS